MSIDDCITMSKAEYDLTMESVKRKASKLPNPTIDMDESEAEEEKAAEDTILYQITGEDVLNVLEELGLLPLEEGTIAEVYEDVERHIDVDFKAAIEAAYDKGIQRRKEAARRGNKARK